MNDEPACGIVLFLLVFLLGFLAVYIWSIVWACRDAGRRGKSPLLVGILVALLSWPIGLVVWLLIRPDVTTTSTFQKYI